MTNPASQYSTFIIAESHFGTEFSFKPFGIVIPMDPDYL